MIRGHNGKNYREFSTLIGPSITCRYLNLLPPNVKRDPQEPANLLV